MHKLSIITITFNSEEYLDHTIRSVAAQTYPNFEYIVVDGASTDGTLDIIKRHEQHIDRWVSEPDGGIADAMNKGVAIATGDFVYFLHSDDYLGSDEALSEACRHLTEVDDVFLFNIYLEKDGNKSLHRPRGFNAWLQFKTGVSSKTDWPSLRRRFLEERRVHRKNCDSVLMLLVYEVYWLLYWPYRWIRSLNLKNNQSVVNPNQHA
jgi:glycosyltransferase involved in cell wall biosynthesis